MRKGEIMRLMQHINHLVFVVAGSNPDPSHPGPKVVEVKLWDGREVTASYYRGPKYQTPDAETDLDWFDDRNIIGVLVDRLLETGESFVTVTGTDDMVCCLEWTIEPADAPIDDQCPLKVDRF